MATEKVSFHARDDYCKLNDNIQLLFGDGADDADDAVGDAALYWDGTVLLLDPTADDSVFQIGDGTTSFDLTIYGSSSSKYLSWDASADTLASVGEHLKINSPDAKNVRINSRNFADTSGDIIALQAKPAANASGTESVYGAQISPRFNDGVAGASLIGLHVDAYLKGTSGNLSGDVRGLQIELVDDGSSGRTITGDVVGIRFRQALAGHTVSADVAVLEVETPEAALKWEFLAKVPDDGEISKSTQATATAAGWLKVKVGSATKYIQLYSDTPS